MYSCFLVQKYKGRKKVTYSTLASFPGCFNGLGMRLIVPRGEKANM